MKPPPFEYTRAESVDHALETLAEVGAEGKVLAGGQSLIPLLAFRLARPAHLTDISRLAELEHHKVGDDGLLTIGALATHRQIETDDQLANLCPAIHEAVAQIGHVAIRNRGTVGGSMAHADPAAEWPALALLFDATFVLRDASRQREVPAREMFTSYMTTALAPNELLTEIRMQLPTPDAGSAFVEVSRRHGDFALAGAGTVVSISNGVVNVVRVSVMSAGMTPLRAGAVEEMLAGKEPDDSLLDSASELVNDSIDPMEDVHGSADYKRHLAKVVTRRALQKAIARARGGNP